MDLEVKPEVSGERSVTTVPFRFVACLLRKGGYASRKDKRNAVEARALRDSSCAGPNCRPAADRYLDATDWGAVVVCDRSGDAIATGFGGIWACAGSGYDRRWAGRARVARTSLYH